jgi:Dolichyl-phosphate-mannose-protein mannosyltransferase
MRVRAAAPLLVLVVIAAGVYAYDLSRSPIYLAPDEVLIALDAHAIATTGRDVQGRLLPLYFQINDRSWYQPMLIYALALVMRFAPISEGTIRVPTLCVGVIDVGLMYALVRRRFAQRWIAVVAAGFLALTPAHFIHSRFAMDYVWPLPFMLGWLLFLVVYVDRRDLRALAAATVILGAGFYSYIAAVLIMPLYFLLTCAVVVRAGGSRRDVGIAAAGFVLPIALLFMPWWLTHSAAYAETVARYTLYDARRLDVLQGLREFLSYAKITRMISLYWSYFDPAFLFLDAAAPRMFSTRAAGVFLLSFAVFLPVGIYSLFQERASPIDMAIGAGFVMAPAAAVLVDESGSINRALEIVPFGVLLAAAGLRHLWALERFDAVRRFLLAVSATGFVVGIGYMAWTIVTQSRISRSSPPLLVLSLLIGALALLSQRVRGWRIVSACLLAAAVVQFAAFYVDYLTDYRARSADAFYWNIHGGLEEIIARDGHDHFPAVYLSGDIPWVDTYWRFYLLKHHRSDLLSRTVQFDPTDFDVDALPAGAVVLMKFLGGPAAALQEAGVLRRLAVITEPGGYPTFLVLQR